ncbi:hypothetical protein [Thalassospira indica]|uniref:50S ribosomal protein L2 n=1 Tax=Thalassospira indica TaxID=1891279 RepID=A0ABM6Y3F3_9PROT|nr:hypothetical protein [Thalassospira indica]AXO16491.1 hypothetical protein DY252_21330 [Thalassospira indica]OAZ10668.1 hypothetical protein TH15_18965 [Thalassospira profundimaris]
MSKKKRPWANESLIVRGKGGKTLAEWTKGPSGRTEKFHFPLEPGGKSSIFSSGKRTYHKSGKTHGHGLFAKGGKKKSWLNNWK